MRVFIDGTLRLSESRSCDSCDLSTDFTWDTNQPGLGAGTHFVVVEATDGANEPARSGPFPVTVGDAGAGPELDISGTLADRDGG